MKNTELDSGLDNQEYVLLESEQRAKAQAIELEAIEGQRAIKTIQSQTDPTLPVLQQSLEERFTSSIPLPSCFNEVENEDDAIFRLDKIERSVSAPAKFNTEFEQETVAVLSSQEYFQKIPNLLGDPAVVQGPVERNDSSDSLELIIPGVVAVLSSSTASITITSLLGNTAVIVPNELERGLNLELIEEVELMGKSRDCCTMPDLCTIL